MIFVMGEGRGHLTQALAAIQLLKGHTISSVHVGKSKERKIPDYFFTALGSIPVIEHFAPNFSFSQAKNINITGTIQNIWQNLCEYTSTIAKIKQAIEEEKPDAVLNFFEPLVMLSYERYQIRTPIMHFGHQFFLEHSSFRYPKGFVETQLMKLYAGLASSHPRLALSFYEERDEKNLYVVPPLLREQIAQYTSKRKGFYLVYLLNHGFSKDIEDFHKKHPEVKLECFWDKPHAPETVRVDKHLTFHRLHDTLFLQKLSECEGLISTAGFESICEALYYAKPAAMVPVHFEQECNAQDAYTAGAGKGFRSFDVEKMIEFLQSYNVKHREFRAWYAKQHRTRKLIEQLAKKPLAKTTVPCIVWLLIRFVYICDRLRK